MKKIARMRVPPRQQLVQSLSIVLLERGVRLWYLYGHGTEDHPLVRAQLEEQGTWMIVGTD